MKTNSILAQLFILAIAFISCSAMPMDPSTSRNTGNAVGSTSSRPGMAGINPDVAQEAFETASCPICIEDLAAHKKASVFLGPNKKRVCQHYVCDGCSESLMEVCRSRGVDKRCPVCRAGFTSAEDIDTSDPDRVFELIDLNHDHKLTLMEVSKGIMLFKRSVPKDVIAYLNENWSKWDKNNDGFLSKAEFEEVCLEVDVCMPSRTLSDSPSFRTHPEDFFEFWDKDNSGALSRAELILAFMHLFKIHGSQASDTYKMRLLNENLTNVLLVYDGDKNGEMSYEEFEDFHFTYQKESFGL